MLRASVEKQAHARFDRAHFTAFAEAGYEFELSYFVAASETFLDVQQAVNLDVLRTFARERIELARGGQAIPPLPHPA